MEIIQIVLFHIPFYSGKFKHVSFSNLFHFQIYFFCFIFKEYLKPYVSFSMLFHQKSSKISHKSIPRQQKANFFPTLLLLKQLMVVVENSEKKMKGSSSSGTRKKSSEGKMFNGESCQRIFRKRKLFPWELMEERKGSQHDCSP